MSRVLRFPRRAHLRASAEFQAVFGGGTRFNHPLFRLQVLPAPADATDARARLGMTVSKRVDKRAAVRNRIRRQVRETFRLHQHELTQPLDLVLVARPSIAEKDFVTVERDLIATLRQAGLLK